MPRLVIVLPSPYIAIRTVFAGKTLADDLNTASSVILSSASSMYQSFNSPVLIQGTVPCSQKLGLARDGVPPLVTLAQRNSMGTRAVAALMLRGPRSSPESWQPAQLLPGSIPRVRREYRPRPLQNRNPHPLPAGRHRRSGRERDSIRRLRSRRGSRCGRVRVLP